MNPPKLSLLILVILLGLGLRLYQFNRPVADWHSWRQADTVSVTRHFVENGVDLLKPRYHDLSAIPSGLDNPQGYRMVEFPFVNALTAWSYQLTLPLHQAPVHLFSRAVSIIFSLTSSVVLFALLLPLGFIPALFSSAIFTFMPFNLFYSTSLLPEVPLVFFTLTAVYFWSQYTKDPRLTSLFLFCLSAALSLLLKPLGLFLAPALVYLLVHHQGLKSLKRPWLYLALIFTLAPLLLWRLWISNFPEGIPASDWLFNSTNIRFKGAFFQWLFADRLGRLIFGFWGLIPFALGLLLPPTKRFGWFFHLWFLGIIAYFIVFATGNVTHDYYQVFTLPILAIFAGLGSSFLIRPTRPFRRPLTVPFLALTLVFSFAFAWYHLRGFYNINNPAIIAAGQAADRLLPTQALVIAPYGGDTAFLYQTHRSGWPIGGDIPQKIKNGATHYITTSLDDEARSLIEACSVEAQTETYTIINLSRCNFR